MITVLFSTEEPLLSGQNAKTPKKHYFSNPRQPKDSFTQDCSALGATLKVLKLLTGS